MPFSKAGSARRRLVDGVAWMFLALAAVGLGLQVTVRDAVPILGFFYYAIPMPIAAALVLVTGLLWGASGLRRRPLFCLAAAAVLVGVWLAGNYRHAPPPAAETDLRVLFWNVGRGRGGWQRMADEIRSADADVIALVEAAYHFPDPVTYWRRQFPGHSVFVAGSGLVLIGKTEIRNGVLHDIGGHSRCATAEMTLDELPVRLVLVDLEANPFLRRGRLIEKVEEIAGLFPETPTVILGDFNTPSESQGFDRLRDSYVNVFETVGAGLLPTWPAVLPILSLDQVWVSPHFVPAAAAKSSSLLSDHSRLRCELGWRPGVFYRQLGERRAPVDPPPSPPGSASPRRRPVLG